VTSSDRDLDVGGTFLDETGDKIRLKTKSKRIWMPAEDIITKMNSRSVVLVNGIAAQGVDKKSVKPRDRQTNRALSGKLPVIRYDHVS